MAAREAQPTHALREPGRPSTDEDDGRRAVQSVEVAGRLLLALADSPTPLPLKELAARADLTPSRAHPYLVSFQRLALVEQEAGSGHYALGAAALQVGLACLHQLDPLKAAEPIANELARSTGHAVALAVWGNFGPTIVRLIEARQPLQVALRVGSVMSVLGTATGRAFAAALPQERVQAVVSREPGAEVGASRMASKALAAELAEAVNEVRRHGLARAVGRPLPGVNAFSAPAFDHEGEAVVVITALDHADRLKGEWNGLAARAVREAAAAISRRLGARLAAEAA